MLSLAIHIYLHDVGRVSHLKPITLLFTLAKLIYRLGSTASACHFSLKRRVVEGEPFFVNLHNLCPHTN
jgi:hypothetical protein